MTWIVDEGSPRFVAQVVVCLPLFAEIACSPVDHDHSEIAVATVERCTEATAASPAPDIPLQGRRKEFFGQYPLAQLQNLGGPVLKAPRIVAVFFGNDWMQSSTEALLQSYGCTSLWHDAVNEYGVGAALYERSVVLPAYALPTGPGASFAGFEAWVAEGADVNGFGALSEDDVVMFFLPPNVQIDGSECLTGSGAHSSVSTNAGRLVRYAYIDTCSLADDSTVLSARTLTATHELIEMVTDPDPETAPAWRSLGPGLVDPSVRLPTPAGVDDEVADLCNYRPVQSPGYPFEVAQAYSNRLARAGMDPCGPYPAVQRIAALRSADPQTAAVDLSSGRAPVVLDIFSDDPSGTYTLSASVNFVSGTTSIGLSALASGVRPSVRDGDAVPLDLQLSLPSSFPAIIRSQALVPRFEVELCGPDEDPGVTCSMSSFPISGLPPPQPPPDAGARGADGGNVLQDAGGDAGIDDAFAPDAGGEVGAAEADFDADAE